MACNCVQDSQHGEWHCAAHLSTVTGGFHGMCLCAGQSAWGVTLCCSPFPCYWRLPWHVSVCRTVSMGSDTVLFTFPLLLVASMACVCVQDSQHGEWHCAVHLSPVTGGFHGMCLCAGQSAWGVTLCCSPFPCYWRLPWHVSVCRTFSMGSDTVLFTFPLLLEASMACVCVQDSQHGEWHCAVHLSPVTGGFHGMCLCAGQSAWGVTLCCSPFPCYWRLPWHVSVCRTVSMGSDTVLFTFPLLLEASMACVCVQDIQHGEWHCAVHLSPVTGGFHGMCLCAGQSAWGVTLCCSPFPVTGGFHGMCLCAGQSAWGVTLCCSPFPCYWWLPWHVSVSRTVSMGGDIVLLTFPLLLAASTACVCVQDSQHGEWNCAVHLSPVTGGFHGMCLCAGQSAWGVTLCCSPFPCYWWLPWHVSVCRTVSMGSDTVLFTFPLLLEASMACVCVQDSQHGEWHCAAHLSPVTGGFHGMCLWAGQSAWGVTLCCSPFHCYWRLPRHVSVCRTVSMGSETVLFTFPLLLVASMACVCVQDSQHGEWHCAVHPSPVTGGFHGMCLCAGHSAWGVTLCCSPFPCYWRLPWHVSVCRTVSMGSDTVLFTFPLLLEASMACVCVQDSQHGEWHCAVHLSPVTGGFHGMCLCAGQSEWGVTLCCSPFPVTGGFHGMCLCAGQSAWGVTLCCSPFPCYWRLPWHVSVCRTVSMGSDTVLFTFPLLLEASMACVCVQDIQHGEWHCAVHLSPVTGGFHGMCLCAGQSAWGVTLCCSPFPCYWGLPWHVSVCRTVGMGSDTVLFTFPLLLVASMACVCVQDSQHGEWHCAVHLSPVTGGFHGMCLCAGHSAWGVTLCCSTGFFLPTLMELAPLQT